jgi:hypothetical protein
VVSRDLIADMPLDESSPHQEALNSDWRGPGRMDDMAFDWELVLGTGGEGLAATYDAAAGDELYRDHPHAVPPGASVDLGDDEIDLPFDEI